jgi:2-dehydro-3-deoxygluconokinase
MADSDTDTDLGVTCLGEAMTVLIPDPDPDPASDADRDGLGYTLSVGGAESNVACSLAALGVPVRWVGRLGDDHFGRVVLRTLASYGVDVSAVEVDPVRLTGMYAKERVLGGPATRMRYYRSGSAASAMGPQLAESPQVRDAALLHLSGITPALSDSCAALIGAILAAPRPGRTVSFDVNLRPALWTGRDPAVLLELARRADLVFVGADEAEALCGIAAPDELRALLPEPRVLVVKQGADGAVGFEDGRRVRVPAIPVEVAEATGAGDAFAAGFIAATLRGLPLLDRLRLGTLTAAGALRVHGDLGAVPEPADVARFLAAAESDTATAPAQAGAG